MIRAQSSRRAILRGSVAGLVMAGMPRRSAAADAPAADDPPRRNYITSAGDFDDVSRGKPLPYTLKGDALVRARLTRDAWRLEITADDTAQAPHPFTLEKNNAIDFAELARLGKTKGVKYLKALQCNNIAFPLGQGLWEGVPLRDLLALCGPIANVRRVYYWGFHNDDPAQIFRSSMALNQVLDTPPGELPPIVAYRLNGRPIGLERGGPVRMLVPWAHGFKSVKWLQHIVLTNHYEANDTYALQNNDPESYLKTAAYFDSTKEETFAHKDIRITGAAMVGWPGLARVEYWIRSTRNPVRDLAPDDPAWKSAQWKPARIEPWSSDAAGLPADVFKGVWGFDENGRPKQWPMRFSVAHWSLTLNGLKSGQYELRARSVDQNGFAQPQPRPAPRSGRNQVQCKVLSVE